MDGQLRTRKLCHQLTCATRMIEMNVGEDQPVDMLRIQTRFSKRIEQPGHRVIGAAIDKGAMPVMDEKVSRIESGSDEAGIDSVNVV
jgi:hypothetical protein